MTLIFQKLFIISETHLGNFFDELFSVKKSRRRVRQRPSVSCISTRVFFQITANPKHNTLSAFLRQKHNAYETRKMAYLLLFSSPWSPSRELKFSRRFRFRFFFIYVCIFFFVPESLSVSRLVYSGLRRRRRFAVRNLFKKTFRLGPTSAAR